MSCGRAGDAILDELGLNLRSSKRGRPKKSVDATPTVVSASTEPITAGPSNANPGTPSDVAKLQSTVDALAEQMAWLWRNSMVMSMTHRVTRRALTPPGCHRQLVSVTMMVRLGSRLRPLTPEPTH